MPKGESSLAGKAPVPHTVTLTGQLPLQTGPRVQVFPQVPRPGVSLTDWSHSHLFPAPPLQLLKSFLVTHYLLLFWNPTDV